MNSPKCVALALSWDEAEPVDIVDMRDSPGFTLTREQVQELVKLAGELYGEAKACAGAECWSAALVLVSASAEAALLATMCIFEPELRTQGVWNPPKGDPTWWSLAQLVGIATRVGWLQSVLPKASDDLFAALDGEAGDAVGFVGRVRNMAVHPGALVREQVRPDLGDKKQMAQTYEIIDGIVAVAFDCLAIQVRTLDNHDAQQL